MTKEMLTTYFRNPPTLFTPRLVLRKMARSDASDMFEYASLPEVTKYLLWDPHPNRNYTARYLGYLQTKYRSGEFYDWAVCLKESGKMIGTCGFTSFDLQNNCAEVGYVLNPKFWRRGIALEALREVLRFAFLVLDLHRVEARFMVGNDGSLRVMEKAGMRFEGVRRESMFVKGSYVSVGVCSMLKSQYLSALPHEGLR